ncbi:hypothetical protein LCGC14_1967500, partial [marine sediment metagenome]
MNLDELERLEQEATDDLWYSNQVGEVGDNEGLDNIAEFRTTEDARLAAALRNAAPELIAAARQRDVL